MALVVEDGTGLATANTFISEADADQYHSDHGNPSAWSGATSPDKETALIKATQFLEVTYSRRITGTQMTAAQALSWPRFGATGKGGYGVNWDIVPIAFQQATAILALEALSNDLIPDISNPGEIAKATIKLGPITESIEYENGQAQTKKFSLVEGLVSDFLNRPGRLHRT